MRCPSSFELRRNVRSCRVLIVTGVLAILSGLALGMVANWPSSVAVGVRVDKETLKPVADRPFQPLFLLPLFLGMVETCGGIVRLYRYSDYRRLDSLMRNEQRPSVFRRGAG